MEDFIFEFKIIGSISIKANTLREAYIKFDEMNEIDETEIIDSCDSNLLTRNCIGTYNEDGSINYFQTQNIDNGKQ